MKISPVAAPTNVVASSDGAAAAIRSLKMATNATPGYVESPQAQAEAAVTDTESKPAIEATEPISPQFAALARERRAVQAMKRQLADEKKAFEEARSQGSDSIPLARLKTEPLSVLLESGVTYDQLTQAILANQGNPEINALKMEISALKEGVDKRFTDQTTQAEQQVLAEMRSEATRLTNQGDTYELIRETGSVPDVMRLIERTYRETGEVLDVSEALQLVEDELLSRNQKLLGLKKMQGLIKQPEPVAQQRPQGMRTLTNKDTASVPMSAKARAMAAFYGTLKK